MHRYIKAEKQEKVLNFLIKNYPDSYTAKELAEYFNFSLEIVTSSLYNLRAANLVEPLLPPYSRKNRYIKPDVKPPSSSPRASPEPVMKPRSKFGIPR